VQKLFVHQIPCWFSPQSMPQQAFYNPLVFATKPVVAPIVPDAQSICNEVCVDAVVGDGSGSHDVGAEPPQEIALTQNHPSKCLLCIIPLS